LPESFVKRLVAAQRLVSSYQRSKVIMQAHGFYRWIESKVKIHAASEVMLKEYNRMLWKGPCYFRKWRRETQIMGRLCALRAGTWIPRIGPTQMRLEETVRCWRRWTVMDLKGEKIVSLLRGRARRDDLREAWEPFVALANAYWRSKVQLRRAATLMIQQGQARCFRHWRWAVPLLHAAEDRGMLAILWLHDGVTKAAFQHWRGHHIDTGENQKAIKAALLRWVSQGLTACMIHWRGVTRHVMGQMVAMRRSLLHMLQGAMEAVWNRWRSQTMATFQVHTCTRIAVQRLKELFCGRALRSWRDQNVWFMREWVAMRKACIALLAGTVTHSLSTWRRVAVAQRMAIAAGRRAAFFRLRRGMMSALELWRVSREKRNVDRMHSIGGIHRVCGHIQAAFFVRWRRDTKEARAQGGQVQKLVARFFYSKVFGMLRHWREGVARSKRIDAMGMDTGASMARQVEERSLLHWVGMFREERARIRSSRKVIYRWKRRGVVGALEIMRREGAAGKLEAGILKQALMRMWHRQLSEFTLEWLSITRSAREVTGRARQAVGRMKLSKQGASFSVWCGKKAAVDAVHETMRCGTVKWVQHGLGRGFRTWSDHAKEARQCQAQARRCAMGIRCVRLAHAVRGWHATATGLSAKMAHHRRLMLQWVDSQRAKAMAHWRQVAAKAATTAGVARRAGICVSGETRSRSLYHWRVRAEEEAGYVASMRRAVARQAYVGVITAWDMWRGYSEDCIDAWEAIGDAIGLYNQTSFLAGWRWWIEWSEQKEQRAGQRKTALSAVDSAKIKGLLGWWRTVCHLNRGRGRRIRDAGTRIWRRKIRACFHVLQKDAARSYREEELLCRGLAGYVYRNLSLGLCHWRGLSDMAAGMGPRSEVTSQARSIFFDMVTSWRRWHAGAKGLSMRRRAMRRALVGSIVRHLDLGYTLWRSGVQGFTTRKLARQRAVVRWVSSTLRAACKAWRHKSHSGTRRRSLAQQGVVLLSSRRLTLSFNAWLFATQTAQNIEIEVSRNIRIALDAHREWQLRGGFEWWQDYRKRTARKSVAGNVRKSLAGQEDPAVQELLRQLEEVDSELRRTKHALSAASPRHGRSERSECVADPEEPGKTPDTEEAASQPTVAQMATAWERGGESLRSISPSP